jgi:hypothetical protein
MVGSTERERLATDACDSLAVDMSVAETAAVADKASAAKLATFKRKDILTQN